MTDDQYDKLSLRLYKLEQKMKLYDTTLDNSEQMDRLFERQRLIEIDVKMIKKMFTKIGLALFKRNIK